MNEIRTDRDRDDAYDDVRRAWRELGDEPVPPALDASVLEAARAAVRPKRTRPRWIVPMSLAATVLLAVGISFDVRREAARDAQQPYAGDARTTGAAVMQESAKSDARKDAPAAAAAPADDVPATPGAAGTSAGIAHDAPPPPASFVPEPVPMEQPAPIVAQRSAPAVASIEAPKMAPPAAPMAPPPPAEAADRAQPASETAIVVPRQAQEAPAAGAPSHQRALPELSGRAAEKAVDSAARRKSEADNRMFDAPKRTPEEWLRDIEALRRAGRTADADAELARFKAAYPSYPQP